MFQCVGTKGGGGGVQVSGVLYSVNQVFFFCPKGLEFSASCTHKDKLICPDLCFWQETLTRELPNHLANVQDFSRLSNLIVKLDTIPIFSISSLSLFISLVHPTIYNLDFLLYTNNVGPRLA